MTSSGSSSGSGSSGSSSSSGSGSSSGSHQPLLSLPNANTDVNTNTNTTNTVASWTDMEGIHLRFQKHRNPAYSKAHEQLDRAYSQLLGTNDVNHLFADGAKRTVLCEDVEAAMRARITEALLRCIDAAESSDAVNTVMENARLRIRIADDGIVHLNGHAALLAAFRYARGLRRHNNTVVVVYLDIDALHFRSTRGGIEWFDPKQSKDIGTTPFPDPLTTTNETSAAQQQPQRQPHHYHNDPSTAVSALDCTLRTLMTQCFQASLSSIVRNAPPPPQALLPPLAVPPPQQPDATNAAATEASMPAVVLQNYRLPLPFASATQLWEAWHGKGVFKNHPVPGGVRLLEQTHRGKWRRTFSPREARMFSRWKLTLRLMTEELGEGKTETKDAFLRDMDVLFRQKRSKISPFLKALQQRKRERKAASQLESQSAAVAVPVEAPVVTPVAVKPAAAVAPQPAASEQALEPETSQSVSAASEPTAE